jgi:hypothetical protein
MAPIPRPPQINPESPEMYEDVENKQAYYERTHNGTKKKKWIIIGSIITTLLLIIAVSIAVPLSMKNNATAEAKINLPKKSANPSKNISGSRGQLGDMVLAQPVENVVMQNILITPPGSDGPFIQPPYAHEVSPYSNMTRLKVFTPANSVKRVFVMGDIHGCLKEMNQLLELVKFQPGSDVLVLSGDLVFKGEDSLGVIRRARELGALCVRGNHDDKVVRLKTFIDRFGVDAMIQEDNIMPEGKVGDPLRLGNRHVNLAKFVILFLLTGKQKRSCSFT